MRLLKEVHITRLLSSMLAGFGPICVQHQGCMKSCGGANMYA